MADRTAAYLFGSIFELIVDEVPEEKQKRIARKFWNMSFDYDFSPYQMEAEKALIKLGLAKKGIDPNYPEDGEIILYARGSGQRGFEP